MMQPRSAGKARIADDRLDAIFHALADRTRRSLLARLGQGPATVTELARPLAMTLPAVSKHIRVLERARLIERTVTGRVHLCRLSAGPMAEAERWLDGYRAFWTENLDALESYLKNDPEADDPESDI